MSRIRCGRVRFAALSYFRDPRRYERVLCRARDAQEDILCECVTPARRLVVRLVYEKHWLAIWPKDREAHAEDCLIRLHGEGHAPADLVARHETSDPPAPTHTPTQPDSTGRIPTATPVAPVAAAPPPVALLSEDLAAVITELWCMAGLQPVGGLDASAGTIWPWALMRDRLMTAARRTLLDGARWWDALAIPDPRRRGVAPEAPMAAGWLLGAVEGVSSTPFGWRVQLHHQAEGVFVARRAADGPLGAWCRLLSGNDPARPSAAIALLQVRRTKAGHLTVEAGAVAPVTRGGCLVAWEGAGLLGDALHAQGRWFDLGGVADGRPPLAGATLSAPTFVVRDTGLLPLGLFILERDLGSDARQALGQTVLDWCATGGIAWTWDLNHRADVPALPPALPSTPGTELRRFDGVRGVPALGVASGQSCE